MTEPSHTADHIGDHRGGPLRAVLGALPSLLGLLLLLAGAELVLRSDLAFRNLPVPRAYYTYDVTRRLHNLRMLQRTQGPIDVLFVGSSVTRSDIRPSDIDRRVRKRTGESITSFNAGQSKMYPTGAALYLERLWIDRAQPRLVVYGVREAELASRQPTPHYLKHGRIERLWLRDTVVSNAQAALIEEFSLLQLQGVLRRTLSRIQSGSPLHIVEQGEIMANERGWRAERGNLARARSNHSKRLWKYRRKPTTDRYRYSLPAIARMKAACEARGIQFALMHLPEHPDRFTSRQGPATWEDYKRRVRAIADQQGIPFIDVTDGSLEVFANDKYFADYHHMRPKGAKRFSIKVADRLVPLLRR